jgi:hypothetical protein
MKYTDALKWTWPLEVLPIFPPPPPPAGQGLLTVEVSRSHSDTPQWVRLLWASDQPDAETSDNTTLTRDKHPCRGGIRTSNPSKRGDTDPRLRTRGYWDRHSSVDTWNTHLMVGVTPAGTEISHSALYHVYRVHAYSLPIKMLCGFITSVMCATCLTHLIPLKLISLTISGETQNAVRYVEERKWQWEERRPVPPKRQYIYQTAPRHVP